MSVCYKNERSSVVFSTATISATGPSGKKRKVLEKIRAKGKYGKAKGQGCKRKEQQETARRGGKQGKEMKLKERNCHEDGCTQHTRSFNWQEQQHTHMKAQPGACWGFVKQCSEGHQSKSQASCCSHNAPREVTDWPTLAHSIEGTLIVQKVQLGH